MEKVALGVAYTNYVMSSAKLYSLKSTTASRDFPAVTWLSCHFGDYNRECQTLM